MFASLLTASKTKRANLTWLLLEIMHRDHTWHDYPWAWVSLTWLLYNLRLDDVTGAYFEKFTLRFRPTRKEIVSSMYNHLQYLDQSRSQGLFFPRGKKRDPGNKIASWSWQSPFLDLQAIILFRSTCYLQYLDIVSFLIDILFSIFYQTLLIMLTY